MTLLFKLLQAVVPQAVVEVVKPPNQLQLSEAQLEEQFVSGLTAGRAGLPVNVVRFNLAERAYKPAPQLEQAMVHHETPGILVLLESDEGQRLAKLPLPSKSAAVSEVRFPASPLQARFKADAPCFGTDHH